MMFQHKSLGKKVIGIFHGVFFSCIFTNHTILYQQWYRFDYFDAFVQIIPDDYYIYKKIKFENNIFIPNLYTFEHTKTPTSTLETNNVLIVGRTDESLLGDGQHLCIGHALQGLPDRIQIVIRLRCAIDHIGHDHLARNCIIAPPSPWCARFDSLPVKDVFRGGGIQPSIVA